MVLRARNLGAPSSAIINMCEVEVLKPLQKPLAISLAQRWIRKNRDQSKLIKRSAARPDKTKRKLHLNNLIFSVRDFTVRTSNSVIKRFIDASDVEVGAKWKTSRLFTKKKKGEQTKRR